MLPSGPPMRGWSQRWSLMEMPSKPLCSAVIAISLSRSPSCAGPPGQSNLTRCSISFMRLLFRLIPQHTVDMLVFIRRDIAVGEPAAQNLLVARVVVPAGAGRQAHGPDEQRQQPTPEQQKGDEPHDAQPGPAKRFPCARAPLMHLPFPSHVCRLASTNAIEHK